MVHACITSRVDYCNSLLYGISKYNLNRLQVIQNSNARIVVSASKYDNTIPILQNLHWLPVDQRIQFKVLLTTYKAVSGEEPAYMCDLMSLRRPSRALRSCSQLLLDLPVSRLKSYGNCAFCVAGPRLWNGLPEEIRKSSPLENVKSSLKTYLFRVAFSVK